VSLVAERAPLWRCRRGCRGESTRVIFDGPPRVSPPFSGRSIGESGTVPIWNGGSMKVWDQEKIAKRELRA
jgi:hypothetical protein